MTTREEKAKSRVGWGGVGGERQHLSGPPPAQGVVDTAPPHRPPHAHGPDHAVELHPRSVREVEEAMLVRTRHELVELLHGGRLSPWWVDG